MEPLEHQNAALAEIVNRARTYFAGNFGTSNLFESLPAQPRWASILCAPTGSGKTTVACMAAKAQFVEASLLRLSVSGWVPCGAHQRGAKETICVIAEHVACNSRTFLVLDEIDKIGAPNDTWQRYISGEIFDLLDGRWPTGLREVEDENHYEVPIERLTQKLQNSVFILSIGTFQNWFDDAHSRRTIGFDDGNGTLNKEITADQIAELMPRELANRHNSSIVRMPELTEADYRNIAQETIDKLPSQLRESYQLEVDQRIQGAVAAKKGVRFLEEAMMAVLVKLSPAQLQIILKKEEVVPEI